ncbi:MAG: CYTH domain-containing protein [Clostridia bacterium]
MNIESELKLIPTKEISREQIIKMLAPKGVVIQKEGKMVHQEDTYFDDKDGTLEKSGGSFRIRRKKDKIAVTYKMPIESDTEYKQRKEYEITVPEEYMKTGIDMQTAIELLKKQYPEIKFPEDMGEILTVINDRNKTNLVCQDGTVVEMAFDTLQGKDGDGELYHIQPEIEFETIEGNPGNLTTIYETINEKFPEQTSKNTLSKYARTKKEITEQKLTLEELSACALFTQILRSTQFDKLQYKGQILHRYDKPTIPQLDNFKDFDYLVDRIKSIKKGEYKIQVPKSIIEKEGIANLLQSGTYEIKDEIDIEDMFCLLLSDVDYKVADEVLADFLDKAYFADDKAITNRLSHSQQVMLGSGLACKSSQIGTSLGEKLTCMISAISHDIGHVPLSHIMEDVIKDEEGFFSHEANGRRVINLIYEQNKLILSQNVRRYLPNVSIEEIEKILEFKKNEIGKAVEEHSRTNSETRGNGVTVQLPRAADKIHYVASDICDLMKYSKTMPNKSINILDDNWIKDAIAQVCADKPYLYDEVSKTVNTYLEPLKEGKYGRAVVNTINSIRTIKHGGHDYYDVNQDIWDFMLQIIKRTKQTRKSMGIDEKRPKMEKMARFVLVKVTNQFLQEFNGDKEKARQAAVDYITNMGEIDLLQYAKETTVLSDDQLKGKAPVTKEEIEAVKNQIYMQIQRNGNLAGKRKEQIANIVRRTKKELDNATDSDIIEVYSKLGVMTEEEIKNVEKIRKTEDTQLKIKQTANLSIEDILAALELEDEGTVTRQRYIDRYYEPNEPGRTICVRQEQGMDKQRLTVKIPVVKKVKPVNRHKYETSDAEGLPIQSMIKKINIENPGLKAGVISDKPIIELDVRRANYIRNIKGVSVTFSSDTVTDKEGRVYKEIEIKCPESSKMINELKKELQHIFGERIKFTKKSKLETFMPARKNEEHDDGENR